MPTYENINTPGQRVTYPQPNGRLEALANWRRVDDGAETDSTVIDRAAAERQSIEEAGRRRLSEVRQNHEAAAEIAGRTAEGSEGLANQTASHFAPAGYQATDGVLSRAKADQRAGALQIGDADSEAHPRTREGLEAKAAADSLAIHAAGTDPGTGVLARSKPDTPVGGHLAATSTVVTAGGSAETPETAPAESGESGEGGVVPPRNGTTGAWRAYAVEHLGLTQEEADGKTRDELIAVYDERDQPEPA